MQEKRNLTNFEKKKIYFWENRDLLELYSLRFLISLVYTLGCLCILKADKNLVIIRLKMHFALFRFFSVRGIFLGKCQVCWLPIPYRAQVSREIHLQRNMDFFLSNGHNMGRGAHGDTKWEVIFPFAGGGACQATYPVAGK